MKKMIFIKCCSRKPGGQADASAVMIILFLQTFSCLFSAWYWAKVHLQENFESIFYQKKLWNDTLFQIKKRIGGHARRQRLDTHCLSDINITKDFRK